MEARPQCAQQRDEHRPARPDGGGPGGRGRISRGSGPDQQCRGFHSSGDGLAGVRLGSLLVLRTRIPRREPTGGPPPGATIVHRRCPHRDGMRVVGRAGHPRPGLCPSHRTADGDRQLLTAHRCRPLGPHGMDVGELHRRRRMGDAAQCDRHGLARRRRTHGHQALCGRRGVHQQDERPLQGLPVQPEEAHGG